MKGLFIAALVWTVLASAVSAETTRGASASESSRASLGATLPTADSNLSVVGDPLMRQLPEVRTVVRIKSGHSVTLPPDDPTGLPVGLDVHPGLLTRPEALPEAKSAPLKASEQLESVAAKDASLDGAKSSLSASKTPAAASKRAKRPSPPNAQAKPVRPGSIH